MNELDPAFLVARGRFKSNLERDREHFFVERDNLLKSGLAGDDEKVVDMTIKISDLDRQIDLEKSKLESQHVKNLASAIFMAMSHHGYANVRAVGRNATYNAVKAIIKAEEYCREKGVDIHWTVSYDQGNIGPLKNKRHVSSVTAVLFKLKGFKDLISEINR